MHPATSDRASVAWARQGLARRRPRRNHWVRNILCGQCTVASMSPQRLGYWQVFDKSLTTMRPSPVDENQNLVECPSAAALRPPWDVCNQSLGQSLVKVLLNISQEYKLPCSWVISGLPGDACGSQTLCFADHKNPNSTN